MNEQRGTENMGYLDKSSFIRKQRGRYFIESSLGLAVSSGRVRYKLPPLSCETFYTERRSNDAPVTQVRTAPTIVDLWLCTSVAYSPTGQVDRAILRLAWQGAGRMPLHHIARSHCNVLRRYNSHQCLEDCRRHAVKSRA